MTKRLNDKKKAVQGITTKVFHALNTGKEAPEGRNTGEGWFIQKGPVSRSGQTPVFFGKGEISRTSALTIKTTNRINFTAPAG